MRIFFKKHNTINLDLLIKFCEQYIKNRQKITHGLINHFLLQMVGMVIPQNVQKLSLAGFGIIPSWQTPFKI